MDEKLLGTNRIDLAGALMATGLAFFLPLSNSGSNLFALLLFVLWLVSGRFLSLPRQANANPVVLVALLLFGLLLTGVLYTSASLNDSLTSVKKYRELLYIAAFIPFLNNKRARNWAELGFFSGMILLLILSFFLWLDFFPSLRYHYFTDPSPISRITHNTFMAFAAFWVAHRMLNTKGVRWPWILALALAVFNIFFMVGGRTGQVIFIALALLFFRQRFSWKQTAVGTLLLTTMLVGFFFISDSFSGRIHEGFNDIKDYEKQNVETSLGYRYQFIKNSINIIGDAPFIGHGTGSFAHEYALLAKRIGEPSTTNPHNEYLLIAVQTGGAGLALFLVMLSLQFCYTGNLAKLEAWLAQGLALTMAVGCLFNSFLLDSIEGHFFAFFSALFLARLNRQNKPTAMICNKIVGLADAPTRRLSENRHFFSNRGILKK